MLFILSQNEENTTTHIMRWLSHFDIPFFRLNREDLVQEVVLDPVKSKAEIVVNNQKIDFDNFNSYWYRRGYFNLSNGFTEKANSEEANNKQLLRSLKDEKKRVRDSLERILRSKKNAGSYNTAFADKLEVLSMANQVGISVPPTLITSKKSKLLDFINRHKKITTKPIHEVPMFYELNTQIISYNGLFDLETFNKLEEEFFPCLFQKYMDKKYELRIFYWVEEIFGTAIFSQSKESTKTDWRNSDDSLSTRRVAFEVPNELKTKIRKLMPMIGLETGSLDFIVTPNQEYYFLEVNPVGQFGKTSSVSTKNAHKHIAKYFQDGE